MICAGQGGICLKSGSEIEWRMLDFCTVSSWILLPPAPRRKLAPCFPAVRIRYNYQFIPRIIPPSMTVKEPSPRASEMESERIENRKVVEQRIKRPGKREDRSCPWIQELSILSWSHLASSEFWFISYVIWPLSRNNLLYKAKTSEKWRKKGNAKRWLDGIIDWWIWVWVNSGSWWWTGRPGVSRFMGSQRVQHDWVTELKWTELKLFLSR